jgi:transmembrane sensor
MAQAAAILAMVVPIGGLVWLSQPRDGEYATKVGEVRVVQLADGSTMVLNTDSRVTVAFDEQHRSVTVHSGEIYFTVSHDADRPFTVTAGEARIKAIGTAFNVRLTGDDVDLLVSEGVVELAEADGDISGGAHQYKMRLHRNEQSKYREGLGERNQLSARQVQRLLLWRNKRLDFDDEKLVEVVDEIERYTHKRIYFASDELQDLRVSGIYDVGDVDNFVLALEDLFPIRVVKITPYISILIANETPAASTPSPAHSTRAPDRSSSRPDRSLPPSDPST